MTKNKIYVTLIAVELLEGRTYEYQYFSVREGKFLRGLRFNEALLQVKSYASVSFDLRLFASDPEIHYYRNRNYDKVFALNSIEYKELLRDGELLRKERVDWPVHQE